MADVDGAETSTITQSSQPRRVAEATKRVYAFTVDGNSRSVRFVCCARHATESQRSKLTKDGQIGSATSSCKVRLMKVMRAGRAHPRKRFGDEDRVVEGGR
jgi:hypothetical protein